MQKVAVEVRSWRDACAARGPSESQTTPARMREKAAPMTEATAAAERSALVRSRLLRMTGRSGGAAKVAKKAMMKAAKATEPVWKISVSHSDFASGRHCLFSLSPLK